MRPILKAVACLAAACGAAWGAGASAQAAFPDRPVTMIVPFPAGGPSDALARGVATRMAADLGQPIVIENLGGANGVIGLGKARKAAADGYTIAFGGLGTHVVNLALYKKLAYDPVQDFTPIGPVGSAPLLLLARADLPAADLRGFADWLAEHPDKASYGSAGVGSISHYGCILLLSSLGLGASHVPYKGVAPAMGDLMAGQTDFMCDQTTTALPQLAGRRIKALAVLGGKRLSQLPSTAAAAESGHALDVRSWNALFAPRGTPQPTVARLTSALQRAVADPALRGSMERLGVDLPAPADATPAAVAALIQRGIREDVPALKAKGVQLD